MLLKIIKKIAYKKDDTDAVNITAYRAEDNTCDKW